MEPAVFTVVEATTQELCAAAYRLRYEVFYGEEGDGRYADHAARVWCDSDDGPPSRLIVALDSAGEVIGTVRLTRWQDKELIAKDAYQIDRLADLLGIEGSDRERHFCRSDRGVVALNLRGSSVIAELFRYADRLALELGCDVLVGVTALANARATRAFEKQGWKQSSIIGRFNEFSAKVMYKDLRTRDSG